MKPSPTDKFLATALFLLAVFHATTHFSAQAEQQIQSPSASCGALIQPVGKIVDIYGQIVQIEIDDATSTTNSNDSPSGSVHIALNTGSNCRIDAWVVSQEWQSWSMAQRQLITIGTLIEISGHIATSDGRPMLQVDSPPMLH